MMVQALRAEVQRLRAEPGNLKRGSGEGSDGEEAGTKETTPHKRRRTLGELDGKVVDGHGESDEEQPDVTAEEEDAAGEGQPSTATHTAGFTPPSSL